MMQDSFIYNYKYIVNRYILMNGLYCVNLSSGTRHKFKLSLIEISDCKINNNIKSVKEQKYNIVNHINDNINFSEYIILINIAMNEIIQLISSDSFGRFIQSESFKKLRL